MKPHQLNAPAAARRVGALTSLAVLALIAGCASSAGIQSEARAIEPQSVGLSSAATPAQAVPADWWRSWGDATLSAVIDQALQSQPSLKVAEARLRRAQAGTAGEEAADGDGGHAARGGAGGEAEASVLDGGEFGRWRRHFRQVQRDRQRLTIAQYIEGDVCTDRVFAE